MDLERIKRNFDAQAVWKILEDRKYEKNWDALKSSFVKSNPYVHNIDALIDGFKKFIALKVLVKDTDASLLSPSYLVDRIWHQMLLDTRFYKSLCSELLPNTNDNYIHHNPNGGNDANARNKRFEHTLEIYEHYFIEEPPNAIWKNDEVRKRQRLSDENEVTTDEGSSDEVDNEIIIKRPAEISSTSSATVSPLALANNVVISVFDDSVIKISVRHYTGDKRHYTVNKSTKMEKVMNEYAKHKGAATCSLHFLSNGIQLHGDHTCASLGLEENDEINVFPKQQGC